LTDTQLLIDAFVDVYEAQEKMEKRMAIGTVLAILNSGSSVNDTSLLMRIFREACDRSDEKQFKALVET
jgi:hypothetical protein